MSKRITTRWYITAWVVWLIALIAAIVMSHGARAGSVPPVVTAVYAVMALCGVVMLVMWIGALAKLARQQAFGWFLGVLILHLVGLGIVGMIAYATAGPDDGAVPYVTRPAVS